MRKGIRVRRRRNVAIVLSSLILIEIVAALVFVGMDFVSSGTFDATSTPDLLRAIAALGCIGIGIFAGKRFYAILAWKGSQRTRGARSAEKAL